MCVLFLAIPVFLFIIVTQFWQVINSLRNCNCDRCFFVPIIAHYTESTFMQKMSFLFANKLFKRLRLQILTMQNCILNLKINLMIKCWQCERIDEKWPKLKVQKVMIRKKLVNDCCQSYCFFQNCMVIVEYVTIFWFFSCFHISTSWVV